MKKQTHQMQRIWLTSLMALFLICAVNLPAQTDVTKIWGSNGNGTIADNQIKYLVPYTGKYYDLTLPDNVSSKYFFLQARGADGGQFQIGQHQKRNGGQGALLSAVFRLSPDQVPAGSTLRFLVGGKGNDAGGGGGTGILYKAPNFPVWRPLMVAGGGGGACDKTDGSPGEIETSGRRGRGYSRDNGGSNGDDAKQWDDSGHPGKGIFSSYLNNSDPVGSNNGSWGFGGGGSHRASTFHDYGGGGGGYSGGGGGKYDYGGGGGGSFITDLANDQVFTKNGTTSNPIDGYVIFQLTNAAGVGGAIYPSSDPFKAFSIANDQISNGGNTQLEAIQGQSDQKWYFENNQVKLGVNPNYCLDLSQSNTNEGTNILLYHCHGGDNQKWIYDPFYRLIRSKIDLDKCLRSNEGSDNIELTTCNAAGDLTSMQWEIQSISNKLQTDQNFRVQLVKDDSKCFDMADDVEAANLRVSNCTESNAQYFVFDNLAIKRANDPNLCLDIEWGKMDNGTNIRLWHCNGTDAQKWIYDGSSGRIHSKKDPNKCVHLAGDTTTDGSNVEISDCSDSALERFVIK